MKFVNLLFRSCIVVAIAISMSACNNTGDSGKEGNKTEEAESHEHQGHNHDGHDHEGHKHGEENMESGESAVVYYCPMKCEGEKTYAEAGTCPVCGMDLVLQEDDESAS